VIGHKNLLIGTVAIFFIGSDMAKGAVSNATVQYDVLCQKLDDFLLGKFQEMEIAKEIAENQNFSPPRRAGSRKRAGFGLFWQRA
jgi:hypothetical protein